MVSAEANGLESMACGRLAEKGDCCFIVAEVVRFLRLNAFKPQGM